MNTIVDIFNNELIYNNNKINYVIDIENNIWFKFLSLAKLLNYKSRKDTLRTLPSNHVSSKLMLLLHLEFYFEWDRNGHTLVKIINYY